MEQAPDDISRGPPEVLLNISQSARIIGAISDSTLSDWAKHGSTPFGFDLDVRRVPVTHHRRGHFRPPRTFLQTRLLIPAAKVEALRDILRDNPRRPGPISREDMQHLEAAARRFRPPSLQSQNSPAL